MKDIVQIAKAYKTMRELLGIKQKDVAGWVGLDKSSYCNFEKLRSTIDKDKAIKLAPMLKISPLWVTGKSENFFYSDNIIYLSAKNEKQIWQIMSFLSGCKYLHIFKMNTTKYLMSKLLIGKELVITIIQDGDCYAVLETPNLKDMDDFARYFPHEFQGNLKNFAVYYLEDVSPDQIKKIESQTITKDELAYMFEIVKMTNVKIALSPEEKKLILKIREYQVPVQEVDQFIDEYISKSS